MSTTEKNKAIVLELFAAITAGDLKKLDSLLADDLIWWVTGHTRVSGEHRKKPFLELIPRVFADAAGPITFKWGDMTAEADRVSLIGSGKMPMKSGKVFASDYHFLFTLRDGKVILAREYMDTAHFNDALGM